MWGGGIGAPGIWARAEAAVESEVSPADDTELTEKFGRCEKGWRTSEGRGAVFFNHETHERHEKGIGVGWAEGKGRGEAWKGMKPSRGGRNFPGVAGPGG